MMVGKVLEVQNSISNADGDALTYKLQIVCWQNNKISQISH